MKTIHDIAAQGDVLFVRVDALPTNARRVPDASEYVVAHSETGHHHVLRSPGAKMYDTEDPTVSYVELRARGQVTHLRSFDTHEVLELMGRIDDVLAENEQRKEPVYYKVIRQRQATPEGWARVAD